MRVSTGFSQEKQAVCDAGKITPICFAFANHSHYGAHMSLKLTDLQKDETGIVTGFDTDRGELSIRLREIGFAEGDNVTPLHFGLFGRNPISVRLNGALIAIRKQDAAAVLVRREGEG